MTLLDNLTLKGYQNYPANNAAALAALASNSSLDPYYRINQTDGQDDEPRAEEPVRNAAKKAEKRAISQKDGLDDEDDGSEDSNSSEHDINSDLDDEENEEDVETEHIILCQYEKVTRVKNKWKMQWKDGAMNLNGRDFLFSKASGDFEW